MVFIAYAGLVTWLSLMPSAMVPSSPVRIPHLDKIAHTCFYLGFTILAWWMVSSRLKPRTARRWVVITAFGYGAMLEILQYLMKGGRAFSLGDMAANGFGVLLGVLLVSVWHAGLRAADPA